MKYKSYLLFMCFSSLMLFSFCVPKQDEVERIIEDGVEVVINHLKPYKVKSESTNLILEEKFVVDTEDENLAEIGLQDIYGFDTDSKGNIYFSLSYQALENFIFKFDNKGNFVKAFGERGQGPGEMQAPSPLRINAMDEIEIYERSNRKLLRFDTNGNFINQILLKIRGTDIFPLSNRNYLVFQSEPDSAGESYLFSLVLYDKYFTQLKVLGNYKETNRSQATRIEVPGPFLSWSYSKNFILVGNSEKGYEIKIHDLEGNLLRIARKKYKKVEVSEDYKQQFLKLWQVPGVESIREKFVFKKYMYPFQSIFVDDEGRFFVITNEKDTTREGNRFDIFNSEGAYIGSGILSEDLRFGDIKIRKGSLYVFREKESGYAELVVYTMRWE